MKNRLASLLAFLVAAPATSFATIAPCNPGPTELLPLSDVIVVATAKEATVKKDGEYYRIRATYTVQEALRGKTKKEITIYSSCLDKTYKRPKNLRGLGPLSGTYCKGGPRLAPSGFEFKETDLVAQSSSNSKHARLVLYLRQEVSASHDAARYYDVRNSRRFYSCREKTYVPDVCGEPQVTNNDDPLELPVRPYIDTSCADGFDKLVEWIRENESELKGPGQK